MRFVALLRGVNVGGKSAIKMSELKRALEEAGFQKVSTYINSGNIIFESAKTDGGQLTIAVERLLKSEFFEITTVVLSAQELKNVLRKVPATWKSPSLRRYIAFIKKPATPEDVIRDANPKEGVDFLAKGPGVVFMSTKMSGLTKSGFPRLSTKPVYGSMTIRNYTTVLKLAQLIGK